jgi:hypothetical protein
MIWSALLSWRTRPRLWASADEHTIVVMTGKPAANMMEKQLREDRLRTEGAEENPAVFNRTSFLESNCSCLEFG